MLYKATFLIVIALTLVQFGDCYEAVIVSRLPSKRAYLEVVYDGQDSVFLLGGLDVENKTNPILDSILVYNITSGSLVDIGKFPVPTSWGTAIFDSHGNIFYFGGGTGLNLADSVSTIWRFNATDPTPVLVGHLPATNSHASAVYDGANHVYIFGGFTHETHSSTRSIIQFEITTNTASIVADLPMPLMVTSAAIRGMSAFVFGGYEGGFCQPNCYPPNIIVYDLPKQRSKYTKATVPSTLSSATSVTVDENIYIVGGYIENDQFNHTLRRFNTESEKLDSYKVFNLPPNIQSSSVYISKTNRIYLFGGTSSPLDFYSEIFSIQL